MAKELRASVKVDYDDDHLSFYVFQKDNQEVLISDHLILWFLTKVSLQMIIKLRRLDRRPPHVKSPDNLKTIKKRRHGNAPPTILFISRERFQKNRCSCKNWDKDENQVIQFETNR